MRHNIRFLLIVTMLLLVTGIGTAQKFVHPGIDMNSADLEYMRNQVLAGKQPWKDAYDLLKEKTPLDLHLKQVFLPWLRKGYKSYLIHQLPYWQNDLMRKAAVPL